MASCTENNSAVLEEELRPTKAQVDCVCPKCGKLHRLNFFWSGKGIPRKYCSGCKSSYYE